MRGVTCSLKTKTDEDAREMRKSNFRVYFFYFSDYLFIYFPFEVLLIIMLL